MREQDKPKRKRQNTAEKRERLAAQVQLFAKQYARKAQKRTEPNDRKYDLRLETRVKQMRPEVLSGLLGFDE